MRQRIQLRHRFEKLGGLMMNGDSALKAHFHGNKVRAIQTRLHEEEEITAEHFVLASGSFFSKGLVSEFDKIYEPVFHSDIIGVEGFNDTDPLLGLITVFKSHNRINLQAWRLMRNAKYKERSIFNEFMCGG